MHTEREQKDFYIFFYSNIQCTEQKIWDFIFILIFFFTARRVLKHLYYAPDFSCLLFFGILLQLIGKPFNWLRKKQTSVTFQKSVDVVEKVSGYLCTVKKERLAKRVSMQALELVCQARAQTGKQTMISTSVCSESLIITLILE